MADANHFLTIPTSWINPLPISNPSSPQLSDSDALSITSYPPPLLGSPFTCGIWGPLHHANQNIVTTESDSPSSSIISRFSPSVYDEHVWISPSGEPTNNLQDVFHEVLVAMKHLQFRLEALLLESRRMRVEAWAISQSLKKLVADIDGKLRQAAGARLDLVDKLYLDQLICLLQGDLRHLPLHKWPFRIVKSNNDTDEELNLVI